MTLEMKHRKTGAAVIISNDEYAATGAMTISGSEFLRDFFFAYFRQTTTHWNNAASIPEKFVSGEIIDKHSDAFMLEYFIPFYSDVYNVRVL
jgi:hypothetical protein